MRAMKKEKKLGKKEKKAMIIVPFGPFQNWALNYSPKKYKPDPDPLGLLKISTR